MTALKAEYKKEIEQGVLLDGLERVLTKIAGQNVDNMNKYMENMTLVTSFKDSFKKDNTFSATANTASSGVTRGKVAKLTKRAKVPSWKKDMSLETYAKLIANWIEINEDVPEYVKYQDFIEELKKNKEIKGLQRYLAEHILPVLIQKTDQTLDKVVALLNAKYGRSRTEKVEEAIEDLLKFEKTTMMMTMI